MRYISSSYETYDELISAFGEEKISDRIEQISSEMSDFIAAHALDEDVYVHDLALTHAVMDYFSDIKRLKDYAEIEHANDIKIKAYETYWLLRRKPIQLRSSHLENDKVLYANEQFLLSRLVSFLVGNELDAPLSGDRGDQFIGFTETLYYYLKFRKCDPQSLELMLLAFRAGTVVNPALR